VTVVEDQHRSPAIARGRFRDLHQRGPNALSSCAAMDEHLGHVRAMRLVLRQIEQQLHRPADSLIVFGHDERALSRVHPIGDATPERVGPFPVSTAP
jgi:hypothetical protein